MMENEMKDYQVFVELQNRSVLQFSYQDNEDVAFLVKNFKHKKISKDQKIYFFSEFDYKNGNTVGLKSLVKKYGGNPHDVDYFYTFGDTVEWGIDDEQ